MRTWRGNDHGYAVVLLSLLLVPLLAAAAVSVDLAARYGRAAEIQRAADAAALAGVAALPRGLEAARAEARQVAARNGFTHGVDGITVDVDAVPGEPDEIQVTITDDDPEQFFLSPFDDTERVQRRATARYVGAVALGSPRNFLGTGNLIGNTGLSGNDMASISSTLRENFWLAVSGPCASYENGDRFNTISKANYSWSPLTNNNPRPFYREIDNAPGPASFPSWQGCNPGANGVVDNLPDSGVPGGEYRSTGYFFAVRFPVGYNKGATAIQVYDPAMCNDPGSGFPTSYTGDSWDDDASGWGGLSTIFTVRTGSLDPLGGTVVAGPTTYNRALTNSSSCNAWVTLANVNPGPTGGIYFIQVQMGSSITGSIKPDGSNSFALRARSGGSFTPCSSDEIETTIHDPMCPNVYALQDMGVYANIPPPSRASFFLADIGPEHNGKTMQVTLFDPGEGAARLRLLEPGGNPNDPNDYASFTWEVQQAPGDTAPTGGWSSGASTTTFIDLIGNTVPAGNPACYPGGGGWPDERDYNADSDPDPERCVFNPQPGSRRLSRSKYNERLLTLTVQLPDDIEAAYGGATWWKIVYDTNFSPTDRTTWSVEVTGDPVRLVPNP